MRRRYVFSSRDPAVATHTASFGSIGVDDEGRYFLTTYAGVAGSPIQVDDDDRYYISNGA